MNEECDEITCRYQERCVCAASFEEPNSIGTDNCIKRMRPKLAAAESLATALTLYLSEKHNHGHNSDEALQAEIALLNIAQAYEHKAQKEVETA